MRWPGRSFAAVVDPRRQPLALEVDLVLVDDRGGGVGRAGLALGKLRLGHLAVADRAEVDDLAGRALHLEAVELLVELVEALRQHRRAVAREERRVDLDRDLVALAVVAHVDVEGEALVGLGDALPLEPRPRLGSPSSSRMPRTSSPVTESIVRMNVRANSSRKSATRSPVAQRSPGAGGTTTGNEPMIRATAFACIGPAPPKATSAKSRGS